MAETLGRVQDVLRMVFDDDALTIDRETTSDAVDGWDSMMHLNVIIAVEKAFGVKFAVAESNGLKEPGQNLGTFCDLIERKLARRT